MICYKDMTFCTAENCSNVLCFRHPENIPRDSKGVFATLGLPIAWCDFTTDCEYFSPKVKLWDGDTSANHNKAKGEG